MAEPDPVIEELAAPARDAAVGALLRAMAQAIDLGGEVTPEPELRDPSGAVVRGGPLNLPRRADFSARVHGRKLSSRVDSPEAAAGDPVALATADGFLAEIAPFRWDAAELTVFPQQPQPDWAPLRRWFLEWFQSRHCEVAPELFGALHSLDGPRRSGRGWNFTVDFGSAPVACLADLISAVASTGAARMRLGQR